MERFQKNAKAKEKSAKAKEKSAKTKEKSKKPRPLSITVRRARRASQERIRRGSSVSSPPSRRSSEIQKEQMNHRQRRRSSGLRPKHYENSTKTTNENTMKTNDDSTKRPKSENLLPSKYQLRYSLKHIRKHKSYPRRLRSRDSRPKIPQWVLQEMGRSNTNTISSPTVVAPPREMKIQSSISSDNNSVMSGASPIIPSPPISPSLPSDRSSWKRRISQRLASSTKASSPKKKKKKQPPPLPAQYRNRARSDGRSRRSLKEILSESDILSPQENDSSELEECWHTIQEIATSEMRHLHFMSVLRDLYVYCFLSIAKFYRLSIQTGTLNLCDASMRTIEVFNTPTCLPTDFESCLRCWRVDGSTQMQKHCFEVLNPFRTCRTRL